MGERQSARGVLVAFGIVEADTAAAARLGRVHGDIGPLDQGVGIVAVVRCECQPDADAHRGTDAVDLHRLGDRRPDLADTPPRGPIVSCRVVRAGRTRRRRGGRTRVASSVDVRNRLRNLDEDPVAGLMAEGVVDLLEPVEIHQSDGDTRGCGAVALEPLRRAVGEQDAVGQTGQRIVQCLVLALSGLVVEPHDQSAVLQSDAGVVRERREHPGVLSDEGVDVAQAVRNGDEADQYVALDDRSEQRVACVQVGEHGSALRRLVVARDDQRLTIGGELIGEELGQPRRHRDPLRRVPGVVDHVAATRSGSAEQPELGPLGSEQILRLVQHRVEHLVGFAHTADEVGEVVEQAEALVSLPERAVSAR